MANTLLATQIILAVLIVIVVLLQKSSSIGLVYSSSNESVFGAKGPAGFMAKLTMFLGLLFLLNTIALGYIYNKEHNKSILDSHAPTKALVPPAPLNNTLEPIKPIAPLAPQKKVQ